MTKKPTYQELREFKGAWKFGAILFFLLFMLFAIVELVEESRLENQLSECEEGLNLSIEEVNYYDTPETFCEYYNGTYGKKETIFRYGVCVFDNDGSRKDVYGVGSCVIDKHSGRWYFETNCEVID